jgi:hypothetical protein
MPGGDGWQVEVVSAGHRIGLAATKHTTHQMLLSQLAQLLLATSAAAAPAQAVLGSTSSSPRPLVIWHGLGDTAHSKGMDQFADFVRDEFPGIFVHAVVAPNDGSPSDEQKAGWVSGASRWWCPPQLRFRGKRRPRGLPHSALLVMRADTSGALARSSRRAAVTRSRASRSSRAASTPSGSAKAASSSAGTRSTATGHPSRT